ncbi:alpha/beta hydrolase [Acinetobacter sp. LoGeW2-3]|uniref:alpha/beta fold hydrolase n=1 Tax=Acinetobacter sp. LoGeW2-3 TaxID=1808001 RepID=UPI000C05AB30|nr:alpha/beta hydrolase [Acinetobacter sp. LoGeW2-3]ATO20819.1 alpha/beta hydrolase [Acinetobacter sp. LoGeW2-3]
MKPALHFTHANGIPSATYRKFLDCFQDEYTVKSIPLIGMNPQYSITKDWRYLVEEVIADIEQQFSGQPVVGLGHSFGGLVTMMVAYKKPTLFSKLIIMDPPFVIGKNSAIFEVIKKLNLKSVDRYTPAGVTLKRKDHWPSHENAVATLRNNRLFQSFDEQCFQDYIDSGIVEDVERGGVTLRIPKLVEAEIFRTVPAWWWRTPRKAPPVPIHLITAEQSQFYKQGLPQGLKKIYQIDYSVLEGGHMFPLEQPEKVAEFVKAKLQTLG